MKRSRRAAWWGGYAAGCAAVVAGLSWVTWRVTQLQQEESLGRCELRRQELLRQALWQMDAWLAPRLAREAGRTWFEYEPYYPQVMAYNRLMEPLADGAVVLPSPLLDFTNPHFPLHFQWRTGRGFTSPQVPQSLGLGSATVACAPVQSRPERALALEAFATTTDPSALERGLERAERVVLGLFDNEPPATPEQPGMQGGGELRLTAAGASEAPVQQMEVDPSQGSFQSAPEGQDRAAAQSQTRAANRRVPLQLPTPPMPAQSLKGAAGAKAKVQEDAAYDYKARQWSANMVQQQAMEEQQIPQQAGAPAGVNRVDVGPLVPVWLGEPPSRLVLARRVRLNDEWLMQGVLVDWPVLKRTLLERCRSVVPGSDLQPVAPGAEADPAVSLASIPAVLVPPARLGSDALGEEGPGGLGGIWLVWLAALGALGVTGFALKSSIDSAVRTSRFASSVTHELRTPLTTFRLYAEMLTDGMVKDPEQVRSYLATLRDESGRLGFLVENVLTWSRVEEGRATVEPRAMSAEELVAAAEPLLRRRCQETGAAFELRLQDGTAQTTADPDRVRQVLFNLVDNACKYAGMNATVRVTAEVRGERLVIGVEDDGPGVQAAVRRRIFRPFDRGERGPGDAVRGLGLGLAISRELARSLGGDLLCGAAALGGARFELLLPLRV